MAVLFTDKKASGGEGSATRYRGSAAAFMQRRPAIYAPVDPSSTPRPEAQFRTANTRLGLSLALWLERLFYSDYCSGRSAVPGLAEACRSRKPLRHLTSARLFCSDLTLLGRRPAGCSFWRIVHPAERGHDAAGRTATGRTRPLDHKNRSGVPSPSPMAAKRFRCRAPIQPLAGPAATGHARSPQWNRPICLITISDRPRLRKITHELGSHHPTTRMQSCSNLFLIFSLLAAGPLSDFSVPL